MVEYGNIWFAAIAGTGAIITLFYVIPMLRRFSPQLDKLEDEIEAARNQAGYSEDELIEIK